MNPEPETEVLPGPCSVDQKCLWVINRTLIEVSRGVPHENSLSLWNRLTANGHRSRRGSPHVSERRLVANDFGHHIGNEARVGFEFLEFGGMLVEESNPS